MAKVYFLRPDIGERGLEGSAFSISLHDEKLLALAKWEYALARLRPGPGIVTVESLTTISEGAKNTITKVKEAQRFHFEAGKTYHITFCRRYRGRSDGASYFPMLMHSADVNEAPNALKPVGNALQEPLATTKPAADTDFVADLKDRCEAAQNKARYAGNISADCIKVSRMLSAPQGKPEARAGVEGSCAKVARECIDRPRGEECRNLIRSYDPKRYGSGTSLLMETAGTRGPQYDSGDTAFMRYLLDIGFDPNAGVAGVSSDSMMELIAPGYATRSVGGTWHDVTPLMIATTIGDRRMVQILLRAGADPNVQNDQGRTALMYAANLAGRLGASRTGIAADLLAAGAKPDTVSMGDSGATALMFAAHNGHSEIVTLLLEHGANTGKADQRGRTALSIAESRGHTEAVNILQEHSKPR